MVKKIKGLFFVAALTGLIIAITQGHVLIGSLLLIGTYLIHEMLLADHIHYSVTQDYQNRFTQGHTIDLTLSNNKVVIPAAFRENDHTLLLDIDCHARPTGYLVDPSIIVHSSVGSDKQYFERGCRGRRQLNISHAISADGQLRLQAKHCRLGTTVRLLAFKNPVLHGKKLLIIAPHPDDAEIAAFGLYSHHQSLVITVTAGESEPHSALQQLITQCADDTATLPTASALKGQLRAWDSVVVPQWAGLKPEQAINLGYPDNQIECLYRQPAVQYPAHHLVDVRTFNSRTLATDDAVFVSGTLLIQDMATIISEYQPDVVVMPHPTIDAHSDHRFTTQAAHLAVKQAGTQNITFLYYANHLPATDQWPFGLQNTLVAPPPGQYTAAGVYSLPLSPAMQIRKACALNRMHDLNKPLTVKRKLRYWLQAKLIGRALPALGAEPYFRKAVRRNELFFTGPLPPE